MRYQTWTPGSASVRNHRGQLWARADATNTCLPQSLLAIVPDCAVTCIQTFAKSQYPGSTCADTSDINYLCTQDNVSGLTIGEGSLQCVVSACTGEDQLDLSAYTACDGIVGARPRSAKTITATLVGPSASPATMDTLPATIGQPTSTQQVSTIVMATDAPPFVAATSSSSSLTSDALTPASSSSNSTSTSPGGTSGAVSTPNQETLNGGLSTTQVVGIAIAGAATALIIFTLVMLFFCIRKRRRERRRSQRRSRLVEHTPPPHYQSPPAAILPELQNNGSSLTVPTTAGRFYGPQQPVEEKRRSFWRKSINPEEIGVAVSPGMRGESPPPSASSQQSLSQLLPAVPNRALWPAPLDLEASRERRLHTQRPLSEATEFEEEPEAKLQQTSERVFVDNQPFILEKPPATKRSRPPAALRLTATSEAQARRTSLSARIPLTPTYDNGNIEVIPPPRNFRSPASTDRAVGYPPLPVAEHKLAPSSTYANRNVLRKKAPARLPLRAVRSPPVESLAQPRNAVLPLTSKEDPAPVLERPNSIASVFTEIEEDTTPEEMNKQLGLTSKLSKPSITTTGIRNSYSEQDSPIRDLRYPVVPRSAAVSRQAVNSPHQRDRLSPEPTPASRPTKNQLVRAEMSFIRTDTTSSDEYLSGGNIEWPVPPTFGASLGRNPGSRNIAELRNNTTAGNQQRSRPRYPASVNEVLRTEAQMLTELQRSPSSKARLTPSKSNNGDLFLTVEI